MGQQRDLKRIGRLMNKLQLIWYTLPDLRFFQLIEYLKSSVDDQKEDFFYVEDDALEKALDEIIERHSMGELGNVK